MNPERLSIGEMADLNYVTIQTLRLYDREGLLKPIYVDQSNNYRYYHINQSARLDMIGHLQRCGLSLEEIKKQLESHNIEDIRQLLENNLDLIDREIDLLERRKFAINKSIENYCKYETLPGSNIIFAEFIHERYLYTHKTDYDYFNNTKLSYEYMIREFKKEIVEQNIPSSYFFNVGNIIREEDIRKRNFTSNEVFVSVDESFRGKKDVISLPASLYLAVCGDDFHKELDLAKKLLDEVDRRGYKVKGDYICEVIAEFPVLNSETRNVFYKIQLPVEV